MTPDGEPRAPRPPGENFRQLDGALVMDTAGALARRVGERFPGSGLSGIARELHQITAEARSRAGWLRAPNWWMRALAALLVLALLVAVVSTLARVGLPNRITSFQELVQMLESAVNDVVFVGVAIFFVTSIESRRKRKRALDWIDELRSLAHIVDMHQLTKDPDQFQTDRTTTASSPERTMTRAELARYLDYCSELVSLTSKVAALYAQDLSDPVLLSAVDEIENLTSGLSRKIWQKIMILDAVNASPSPEAGS